MSRRACGGKCAAATARLRWNAAVRARGGGHKSPEVGEMRNASQTGYGVMYAGAPREEKYKRGVR